MDKQRAEDRSVIDNDYEKEYWMNKFNVSRDESEEAIKKYGNSTERLKDHFMTQKK